MNILSGGYEFPGSSLSCTTFRRPQRWALWVSLEAFSHKNNQFHSEPLHSTDNPLVLSSSYSLVRKILLCSAFNHSLSETKIPFMLTKYVTRKNSISIKFLRRSSMPPHTFYLQFHLFLFHFHWASATKIPFLLFFTDFPYSTNKTSLKLSPLFSTFFNHFHFFLSPFHANLGFGGQLL